MRAQLRDSPSESAPVSIHTYCTLFPLNKYFTSFTTFPHGGNSFLQNQRARGLSLTTGLVARIWCFHHHDPAHLWLRTQALLRAVAGWGHPRSEGSMRQSQSNGTPLIGKRKKKKKTSESEKQHFPLPVTNRKNEKTPLLQKLPLGK